MASEPCQGEAITSLSVLLGNGKYLLERVAPPSKGSLGRSTCPVPGRPRRKDAAPEGRARSPPGSRRSSGHSGVLTHRAKVENPRVHGLEVSTRAWYCVSSNPGQRPGAPAGQQHVRPPGARRLAPSEQRPLQVDTAVTLLQPPFVFFAAVDKKTISCVFISSSDSRFQRVGVASVNLQSLANLQSPPVSVE